MEHTFGTSIREHDYVEVEYDATVYKGAGTFLDPPWEEIDVVILSVTAWDEDGEEIDLLPLLTEQERANLKQELQEDASEKEAQW